MKSAIDFSALIGAQISALIDAEAEGAERSAQFIEEVGFERLKDGTYRLRVVTFEMQRRGDDGDMHTHLVQIPLLTLVPIPLLSIEQADLEFDLRVESLTNVKPKETTPAENDKKKSNSSFWDSDRSERPKVKLKARLARTAKEDTKTAADLSMKVRIVQSSFPTGIETLLNVSELAVADKKREK